MRALPLPDPALTDPLTGIVLRPWGGAAHAGADADAEALAAAWADPDVAARTRVPADAGVEAARTWIAGEARRRGRGLALDLVVSPSGRGTGAPVLGEVGLAHLDPDGRAEVGFWLAPDARGRGVATSAVRLVTAWALHAAGPARSRGLALRQLWARTVPGDHRAAGVLGRAGYRLRGEAAGSAVWAIGAASLPA